jgi:DNA polymerase III subunit delta
MKLQQRDFQRILTNRPPEMRGILIFGPDSGHVGETADAIAASRIQDTSDPFRSTMLTGDILRKDPAALLDAATAMSLIGGDRLVRVRGVTDAIVGRFQDLVDAETVEALVLVEAENLDTRSKLRKLFESAPNLGALGCYGDEGPGLVAFIKRTLEELGVRAKSEAIDQLAANLGGDRRQTRGELEKLALMVGPGGEIDLEAVVLSVGDSGSLALDDIALAIADGNVTALDRALGRARADGENSVRILRSTISHFQRLHHVMTLVQSGVSPDAAIGGLRPPIFRNRRTRFESQLNGWSVNRLEQCLERLSEAEFRCKSTGIPDDAVCAQTLIGLSLSRSPARQGRRAN